MKVAIIGSGLAGISAARALVKRGLKPVIFDYGLSEGSEISQWVNQMASQKPSEWDKSIKGKLFVNPTMKSNEIPRKLAFGSDYFYGTSINCAPVTSDGVMPPFSYAKGGFSVGWGASALPPDDCDIADWPIRSNELARYYSYVLEQLPYSAREDGLSQNFPLYTDAADPLELSSGNKQLLVDLSRLGNKLRRETLVFGQARLLTRASSIGGSRGCQYCGQCMGGCVYGSIYKSSQTLDSLVRQNLVEYRKGFLVDSLNETGDQVKVSVIESGRNPTAHWFNRVFLAAGAVNSTRIILKSFKIYNRDIPLLGTNGFVVPMLRVGRLKGTWPKVNTQPAIFLEYKVNSLSNHWIHAQLSTPNDLVYELFGVGEENTGIPSKIKKRLLEHVVIANCNLHSDHSNRYLLTLKNENQKDVLHSKIQDLPSTLTAHELATKKLASIGRKLGWYMLKSKARHSFRGGGFHVGGSMPMKGSPSLEVSTNCLGNPNGSKRVHVVDSSVLPSLPGTTIGLVSMANAYRIATHAQLN